MRLLGIVLIVVGLVGVIYGGVTWTTRENVVDVGPVHVTHDKQESLPLPPIAGAICLVAGIALVVTAGRARA